jgi:hypothetical protein
LLFFVEMDDVVVSLGCFVTVNLERYVVFVFLYFLCYIFKKSTVLPDPI